MSGSIITDIWANIQLNSALTDMVNGFGAQVQALLPTGILIYFVRSIPRLVRGTIAAFV